MVTPIERKKVSSIVLEELKKMIRSGELPPNQKLPPENELARLFGVSRSPIREALSVLAASGLIESRQGGGSWVRKVHLAEMLDPVTFEMIEIEQVYDLLEMRTIIEAEAAALAAKRHTIEEIEELRRSLEEFHKTVEDQQNIGYEADDAFHRLIVKAAHNSFLLQTIDNLADLRLKALKFSLKQNVGSRPKREEVFKEHVEIFEAIRDRDSRRAQEAVQKHLINARIKLGDKRLLEEE